MKMINANTFIKQKLIAAEKCDLVKFEKEGLITSVAIELGKTWTDGPCVTRLKMLVSPYKIGNANVLRVSAQLDVIQAPKPAPDAIWQFMLSGGRIINVGKANANELCRALLEAGANPFEV